MKLAQYPLLCILQLAAQCANSQPQSPKFAHIGTQTGLSANNVTCILRDDQGFMWFGTHDGLNRFNGYDFEVYRNIPDDQQSLSSNFVTSIIQDRHGDIWVGTWGGGLNRFDKAKRRFIRYSTTIHSDLINALLEDSEGRIWVGSKDHGAWVFDPKNGKVVLLTEKAGNPASLSDNDVVTIAEDHTHNIWLGTAHGGINKYDPQTRSLTRYKHRTNDPASLAANTVTKIFEDLRQRLWIGMRDGGVDLLDQPKGAFTHFKNNPRNTTNVVSALEDDDQGNLWIGMENAGISILSSDLTSFHKLAHDDVDNTSLNDNAIYSLYRDPQGNMWIGTADGGIDLFNKSSNSFIHYRHNASPESLANNNVLDILGDGDHLWIGTGSGLDELDQHTGTFSHFLQGNILSLCRDAAGNLWAGTWGKGISVVDQRGKLIRRYKHDDADSNSLGGNNVYAITDDGEGTVWVATYGDGLNQFNTKSGGFHHYKHVAADPNSPGSDRLNTMLSDSNGILWIGTYDGGLDRLDEYTGIFKHFVHQPGKNSLSNNTVNYIYADSRHNFWVCTADGLNLMDRKTGHFTVYSTKDGLPSSVIFGILEDDHGKLWISTNNGLSCLDPATGKIRNFSAADGLQSNQFKSHACYKAQDGALYFGGVNGFNKIYPDSIRDFPFDPPLLITGFAIFNKEVPIGDSRHPSPLSTDITMTKDITIPYKSSVISLEFASLNYTVADKKHYAYRLDGFDNNWIDAGIKRTVTYTNLNPGTYTFEVRGWDNDGHWSPTLASLQLTVLPPLWQTWWFRILAVVFVIAVVFAIFRLRLQSIKKQKEKLEKEVDHRTRELALSRDEERQAREEAEKASRAKSEFMANISHELRTPMNAIIGFTDLTLTTTLQRPQREYLENVHRSGYNLLGIINDILDHSKIEAGKLTIENRAFNLCTLVEETIDSLAIKAFEKKLELIGDLDPSMPVQLLGDPGRIQQIVMNLLGNAIKFTAKGEIVVSLKKAPVKNQNGRKFQPVTLTVKDTGIGIPREKLERIFESFTQADTSTTRRYGGTGLGLTIARNLAEMMNGTLDVQSEPGKGSTFTLSLSLEIVDEMSTVPPTQRPVHQMTTDKISILVAEDDPLNMMLINEVLTKMGFSVIKANDGTQVLDMLKTHQPAMILMDVNMPVMDGLEATQLIRAMPRPQADIPIVALTAAALKEDREKCLAAGMNSFVTKPFRLEELEEVLNKYITVPAQNKAPHPTSPPTP